MKVAGWDTRRLIMHIHVTNQTLGIRHLSGLLGIHMLPC